MEYSRQSKDGLVQQGWKDSNDSVFHADGTLATGPIALCEVQGYVYAAKRGAADLASHPGQTRAGRVHWNPRPRHYDPLQRGFLVRGYLAPTPLRSTGETTVPRSHVRMPGIASTPELPPRITPTRWPIRLLSRDFYSGWGIRTVASGEARYNPISYHNGSVWPHDNALIAAGLARYGFKDMAGEILSALLAVSTFVDLHRLPELFCGLERRSARVRHCIPWRALLRPGRRAPYSCCCSPAWAFRSMRRKNRFASTDLIFLNRFPNSGSGI